MARVESGKNDLSVGKPLAGLSIAFDLDGTLVDTAPDLVRVTNEIIALEGLPETDYQLARAVVGFGTQRLIGDAVARADRTLTPERFAELRNMFLLRYSETIADHSRPYPGVEATLVELRGLGAELSVCTNKPGWLARPLLKELGLAHYFVRTVGGDEAPLSKPDPRHIYKAVGHHRSDRIVMVGDSFPDMRAGQNAKALTVLMTYGYSHTPQIRLRANIRLRNFRRLTSALQSYYAAQGLSPAR